MMTTSEAPPEPATFKIVACGTCDVLFRTHPGRPSCPVCGGDPDLELGSGTIETPSSEAPAPTEEEAPAPAEATSEGSAEIGPRAPPDVQGQEEGQGQEETSAPEADGDVPTEGKDI